MCIHYYISTQKMFLQKVVNKGQTHASEFIAR